MAHCRWIQPLLDALHRGEPAVLVHVAAVHGSAPREAGARMLVMAARASGTIGGGELEHQAIRQARELLGAGAAALSDRALGPELGQCCGGAVTLAFEPFAPEDCGWLERLAVAAAGARPLVRTIAFGRAGAFERDWQVVDEAPAEETVIRRVAGGFLIREWVNPAGEALFLFGAGHVGRAVVRAVEPLGFAVTWVDGRADAFPSDVPAGVRTSSLAMPELAVADAPPGAFYLVMTHSHPLDEEVCATVLGRGDFAFLGLIGSATKRARFLGRLRRRGIAAAALERLTCPIGLPDIKGKEPAVIAASVAADLLLRREARRQLRPADAA
ncbi:MAG TPA: xanthine dehydrogenase accessory protein XdhC [Afifellaceae bacterium]|nr:xanthine dehydrogenase accessory protein XdhC [Afifellaceae bacterium]